MHRLSFLLLLSCVLAAPYGTARGADCTPDNIRAWETELAAIDDRVGAIDRDLDALREQLAQITAEIDAEKARQESRNPIRRARLQTLLKDSRTTASSMDALTAEKDGLTNRRTRVAATLRDCYGAALNATLQALLGAVRSRQYDRAKQHMETVEQLETKLGAIGLDESQGTYPRISEEFVRSSLASLDERAFLRDTLQDLQEKAQRDSVRLSRKISDVRRSIQLKQDLLDLIDEAAGGSVEGGTFFSEFGRDEVALQIQELQREEERQATALKAAQDALAYYRSRITFLTQLLDNDVE